MGQTSSLRVTAVSPPFHNTAIVIFGPSPIWIRGARKRLHISIYSLVWWPGQFSLNWSQPKRQICFYWHSDIFSAHADVPVHAGLTAEQIILSEPRARKLLQAGLCKTFLLPSWICLWTVMLLRWCNQAIKFSRKKKTRGSWCIIGFKVLILVLFKSKKR